MPVHSSAPRLRDENDGRSIGGRSVPYESGVLPDDFVECLHLFKERSGLTWSGLAEVLGVDIKQLLRWRDGTEPCGGAFRSLVRGARWIPGGLDLLVGEDFLISLREGWADASSAYPP